MKLTIIVTAMTLLASATAGAASTQDLSSNCRIESRSRDRSGLIVFAPIASTKSKEGLDFINPKDGKHYRLRVFSNPGSTIGLTSVDAIIQDMTVKAYSTKAPYKETTTADGYVAHSIVEISSATPSLVIASEINQLVAICSNISVQ